MGKAGMEKDLLHRLLQRINTTAKQFAVSFLKGSDSLYKQGHGLEVIR